MCGICGAAWLDPARALPDAMLDGMVEALTHRGPDDAGTYRDDHAALGFRRLSILDLAGAHQPLANEDGSVWVAYNGEIYNFQALRRRLEAKGHTLRSSGDTEVLVHLYEDEGPGFVSLLRGMFALAIWDVRRRKLVLGRDRLGQKPLVYRLDPDGGRIVFASELKSLVEADVPREIDPRALDRYLTYGYVPHPFTIYQGIFKLPPAHLAIWEEGRLTLRRYWSPAWDREERRTFAEDVEQVRSLLPEVVAEQMISDVPVGAFLSGGIDSTLIVGLMQRASSHPVRTFSIGFDDPAFDESAYARMAAEHLGTEHHAFIVEPNAWETLPALAETFDEPFADSSALPTWHVARLTREHVTVALTGDAGDELFGGYDRYRALALADRVDQALSPWTRRLLSGPLARAVPASARAKTRLRRARRWMEALGDRVEERYARWMVLFPEADRATLYHEDWLDTLAEVGDDPLDDLRRVLGLARGRDVAARAMVADLVMYLPDDLLAKVDMTSMAHSLECRGPFLDHRVVELAAAMSSEHKLKLRPGRSKAVLKAAFPELLPPPIRRRGKMGFGVPLDRWFRGPLAGALRDVLLDSQALGRGFFRPEAVERLVEDHVSGARDHAYRLWGLMMLEFWCRTHYDKAARSVPSPSALRPASVT